MSPASPATKPRLPSPPPFTEVQIGPKSPSNDSSELGSAEERYGLDKSEPETAKRVRPGTKAVDMVRGTPLKPLSEFDSAFQLQEYLMSLYTHHTQSPHLEHTTTLTRETALLIANPPNGVERALWLYELCRLLVLKANNILVSFFADDPPCSANTCPEMRASEWQYLCAVHEPPKPCCAIDYCCHTLDWAATTLASQKHFPSRLTLGNEANGGSQAGVRQLTNIMRRVYRIFAHAWFQHRPVFWHVESDEGLYMLFKTVCDVYTLIPEENYTIPPEAEGLAAKEEEEKREGKAIVKEHGSEEKSKPDDSDTTTTISTGATTRRHKSTHSFSASVTAISEVDEDESKADSPVKDKPIAASEITSSPTRKEAPPTQIPKTVEVREDDPSSTAQNPTIDDSQQLPEASSAPEEVSEELRKETAAAKDIDQSTALEGEARAEDTVPGGQDTEKEGGVAV